MTAATRFLLFQKQLESAGHTYSFTKAPFIIAVLVYPWRIYLPKLCKLGATVWHTKRLAVQAIFLKHFVCIGSKSVKVLKSSEFSQTAQPSAVIFLQAVLAMRSKTDGDFFMTWALPCAESLFIWKEIPFTASLPSYRFDRCQHVTSALWDWLKVLIKLCFWSKLVMRFLLVSATNTLSHRHEELGFRLSENFSVSDAKFKC